MSMNGNRSLAAWFWPLFLGPFVGAFGYATFRGLVAFSLGAWIVYSLIAPVLAVVQVLVFAVVDVIFLSSKVRALPTGARAWAMSIGAPVLVGAWVGLFPRPSPGPHAAFIGAILTLVFIVPMVVTSISMRLVFGKPIDAR